MELEDASASPDLPLNTSKSAPTKKLSFQRRLVRRHCPRTPPPPHPILSITLTREELHREWLDGKWVRPQKQRTAGLMFSAGKKVEVSFEKEDYRDAWFPATVLEDAGHGSFLAEYQRRVVDDDEAVLHQVTVDYLHIRPSPPHLRDRSFDLLEKVDAFYDFGWWSGVITKERADSRYIVFFKHTNKEKELTYSELRPHMDWKDGKWFSSSRQSKRGKGGETNSQLIAPVKKPGRPPRSQHGVQGSICQSAEDIVNIPVVTGLESNGVKNARAKIAHHLLSPKSSVKQTSGEKEQLADSLTPTSVKDKEVNNSERGTVSSQNRKRGRPPKVLAQSPKISAAVNKQNGDAAPNLVAAEDYLKKPVSSPTSLGTESVEKYAPIPDKERLKLVSNNMPKQKNTLSSVMKISLSKKGKLLEEETAQASPEQSKKQSSVRAKQGRRRTRSANTESSNQDSEDASKEKVDESSDKDGPSRKDDMAVDVLPSTMSDDQPLAMWFEGMHPPSTVDMSVAGACVGVRTKEQEIKRAKVVGSGDGESVGGGDIGSLPFVKESPVWETIGGMEVFRMIPQKPHFRPLVDGYKESVREGLAVGSMVTFGSVVEKTGALRFDDDRSTIEDYLENLVELESHGFNVKVVRDRLMALLLLKSKNGELNKKLNGIRSRIEEHSIERSKVDEEIEEIDKRMWELSEKRSLAVSKKEMKSSEITGLEKQVVGINEGISGIRSEFEELASSPWQP